MECESMAFAELPEVQTKPDIGVTSAGRMEVKSVICEEITHHLVGSYREKLQTIVLTGSLARNEASVGWRQPRWTVLGDAEFLLVLNRQASLPCKDDLRGLGRLIETRLKQRGVDCPVSLDACHVGFFLNLRPSIFAYELRTCGEVVWGDHSVLSLIPSFSADDIPLEDAWHLLCNRLIEQHESLLENDAVSGITQETFRYRTAKLYLDMATSLLVYLKAYQPTYQERTQVLRSLAKSKAGVVTELPVPLTTFTERVEACTEYKLHGCPPVGSFLDQNSEGDGTTLLQESLGYARALWKWELLRLTASQPTTSEKQLIQRLLRTQPMTHRLRGWLYVVRKRGWHRSWRQWPRWAQLAWNTSPRYCVYLAACELIFGIPLSRPNRQQVGEIDLRGVAGRLPEDSGKLSGDAEIARRQCGRGVLWNYHEFLQGTCA